MNRFPTQRKSAVLILALLLMGTITASSIALSTVIGDSTHQTRTINEFIAASLAADSGIERSLAIVKAGRRTETFNNTTSAIPNTPPPGSTVAVIGSGGTDKFEWPNLKPRESVTFDILNYDTTGNLIAPATQSITISALANAITSPPYPGQGALDVSWVGLNTNGIPAYSGRRFLTTAQVTGVLTMSLIDIAYVRDISGATVTSLNLSQLRGFRIRLTAIDRPDIANAAVTPAQQILVDTLSKILVTGNNGFPSRVYIESTGVSNLSQSQKTASVLWQLPASGVFNYVLFTEGAIIPQS